LNSIHTSNYINLNITFAFYSNTNTLSTIQTYIHLYTFYTSN
jgi:hypothetical protein